MNPDNRTFTLDEVVVGHMRVGDVDVAYFQVPHEGRHVHWHLGVDGAGVAIAQAVDFGTIVPGRPHASRDEIANRMARLCARRDATQETMGIAASDAPWFHDERTRLTAMAEKFGLREEDLDLVDGAIREATEPLGRRLGRRRIDLGRYYMEAQGRRSLAAYPRLDRDEALARILCLSDAEAKGLSRFFHHPLLKEIVEAPGLRLDRPEGEILAELVGIVAIPEAAARRLEPEARLDVGTVKALRTLPLDWVPARDDGEGWSALVAIARALDRANVAVEHWRTLCDPCKGDWPAFRARCLRAIGQPEVEERPGDHEEALAAAVANASDLSRGFGAVLTPMGEGAMAAGLAIWSGLGTKATWGDRGLPAVLENSREWHERFVPPAMAGVTWTPILPRWTHPGTGIEVVPLTGSNELTEEGKAMRHCVGGEGYALASLRDLMRVVSLRRDGVRVSTGEIALGGPHAEEMPNGGISQHYAHRNTAPPREAAIALMSYVASQAVRSARMGARRNEMTLPIRSRADQEALLEAWRPYLAGEWKTLSLDAMQARVMAGQAVVGTTRRSLARRSVCEDEPRDAGPAPFR